MSSRHAHAAVRALVAARALLVAIAASAALFAGGCYAPTLPLPPPTALVSPPDADGYVTVSGSAVADAFVFVLNEERSEGVIGRADEVGRYAIRIQAATGDGLTVWYREGSADSSLVSRIVP